MCMLLVMWVTASCAPHMCARTASQSTSMRTEALMDSSECWLGHHDNCSAPDWCECLCHLEVPEYMAVMA